MDSADQLEELIGRLLTSGFDRADIDLMARRATALAKLGEAYVDPEQLADRPGVPRRSLVQHDDLAQTSSLALGALTYISSIGAALPIVASGGGLAAAAIGGIVSGLLKERNAEELLEALQSGGLAVFAGAIRGAGASRRQDPKRMRCARGPHSLHRSGLSVDARLRGPV